MCTEQYGRSEIIGLGSHLPADRVSTNDLMAEFASKEQYGLPERYLSSLVGVEEVRYAPMGAKPSDLAISASISAIEDAGVDPREIGYVIYCGIERDWVEPATAHRVQEVIGASKAACFDITNACHGFMNGLAVADAFIAAGSVDTVLICTGEMGSNVARSVLKQLKNGRFSKKESKMQIGALTLGDAGGAMILRRSNPERGFQRFRFDSAGQHAKLCHYAMDSDGCVKGEMDMETICKASLAFHQSHIDQTYKSLTWEPDDISCMIAHQAGVRPHKWLVDAVSLPMDKAPYTVSKLGNIASASIPVGLSLNRPVRGDKVLILSTGSGLSIGQTGLIM